MHIVSYMVVFCGLPGPQEKMVLPGGSGSGSWILILFSHTWGMSARMRITYTGIIKSVCKQMMLL